MKILYVVSNLMIGGVEKVCWELVSNLDKSKYQIDFLVANDKNQKGYYEDLLKSMGCAVYKGGYVIGEMGKNSFLKYERELLKSQHYDIVHAHMDFMNAWILKAAKKAGVKKRVSHVHSSFEDKGSWNIKQKLKHKLQTISINLFSTHRLGPSHASLIDFYGGKGHVLFNGFDISRFLNIPMKKSDYSLITVGRISEEKNPIFICEIMKILAAKDKRYELYYIGDGPMRNQVDTFILKYNLEENIHMVGATTEILPYLSICGYALYPSRYEGLGISIVEAQLAQCFAFFSKQVPQEADLGFGLKLDTSSSANYWAETIHNFIQTQKSKNLW